MQLKKKKLQVRSLHDNQAFRYLWNAHEHVEQYQPLKDPHTQSFYATPTVQKHLRRGITQENEGQKGVNALVQLQSISRDRKVHKKKKKQKLLDLTPQRLRGGNFATAVTATDLRVFPYFSGLKQSSKEKLMQFKENMKNARKLKNQSNKCQMKANIYLAKLQKPQIKVIHTLQPISQVPNRTIF